MKINLIKDIETLNDIIQGCFLKNTITNNYMLSNAYLQYIADKRLFCVTKVNNACILVEKSDFYQMYYFINNQNELMTFDADKPITMEIIYRGEAQRPNEVLLYWEKCGFKQHILREHMVAYFKQLKFFNENDTVKVKYAETDEEIIFTKNIIEQTFDKYTGDIMSLEEVKSLVKKQNVLCAYVDGSLCGVIKFEIKNSIVFWGHFAISEEFRGKGVATKLMQSFFRLNATSPDTRIQMWVVDYNTKAKIIYERIGFNFDNKISQSMIKEYTLYN